MNYLDRNEFNFAPSPAVVKAFREFDVNKLCFYTRIYDEGKKSIFSVYLSEKYGIDESQIMLGYGAEDLLKQAVHYFITDGGSKTMLIPQFSWWYYKSIADEVKGTTLQYPVNETEDSFCYDAEGLRKMVEDLQPRILLIASPNNPTGNRLAPAELEALIDTIPEQTLVLVDEAYAAFVSNDLSYIKKIVERKPNVIFCRTLSKFYGLPGLRMGFGFVSKSEEMNRFSRYANKYLGYDRLSEDLAIAALDSEDYYREIADVMEEARKMYASELGALDGFKVYRSKANFILIRYPIAIKEALQREFADCDYEV